MFPYSNDTQEYNKFMSKLIEKVFKLNGEVYEEYSKLSPNAKIMADNARDKMLNCVTQIHNLKDIINILNDLKK